MTVPFTYLVFHKPTKKAYYGVRYANGCHPSDLWSTYFTSSKRIQRLIQLYGVESFSITIKKIFKTKEAALLWESKVLSRLNLKNGKWLNVKKGKGFAVTSETMKECWSNDSYRKKQIESQRKTWSDPELRDKHSKLMKSKITEERRIATSERNKREWAEGKRNEIPKKISKTRLKNVHKYKKRQCTREYTIEFIDGRIIKTRDLTGYAKSLGSNYQCLMGGFRFKRPVPSLGIKQIY